MTILALLRTTFKQLHNNILYGPDEIPIGHHLYGKKHHRCGCYKRSLRFYDKRIITVIVYRFYCPETLKTYSLLPHFITRYERHINTVIEDVLSRYFRGDSNVDFLAEDPSPSPWTVRRWIKKFSLMIEDAMDKVEKFLIEKIPSYRPVSVSTSSMLAKLDDVLTKAHIIMDYTTSDNLYLYGPMSYYFYAADMQSFLG
jgi:hypothetical protein